MRRWIERRRRIRAIRKAQAILLRLQWETLGGPGNGILSDAWVYLGWEAIRESRL